MIDPVRAHWLLEPLPLLLFSYKYGVEDILL